MPADIEIPKHRKKRPARKQYVLEWRRSLHHDWSTWKRYPTKEQMDKALSDLTQKDTYAAIEYRIKP